MFLTDTLAQAGSEVPQPNLAFLTAPMVKEREAADAIKTSTPILAIFGNPPYRRLRRGEVQELVGPFVDGLWEDLKRPVRDGGGGGR